MSNTEAGEVGKLFTRMLASHEDARRAREELHRTLQAGGYLSRVTLHRYMCAAKGCQIATVFSAGGLVLCAVRDYKFSPGLNDARSVPEAREKNTLDGERHWPSHVYDVSDLASWGGAAGFDLVCRHYHGTVMADQVLALVEGIEPGHPGKPTRLV